MCCRYLAPLEPLKPQTPVTEMGNPDTYAFIFELFILVELIRAFYRVRNQQRA